MILVLIQCDLCPNTHEDHALTLDDAERHADLNGWTCDDGLHLCPAHRNVDQAWLRASHEGVFL